MPFDEPIRAETLRAHNKKLVLYHIFERHAEGTSQSALVETTGLKAPTIFRIFNELQSEGFIEAVSANENGASKRKGRRPQNFRARRDVRYSFAVEFWGASLSIGAFDFWNERVHNVSVDFTSEMDADMVADIIASGVQDLMRGLSIPREKIIGVGVAAPGQVDLLKNRIAHYPRISGMRNYPIVEKLRGRLDVPVILHNNCAALALGESRYGRFRETEKSLFVFLIRSGVNGSFVDGGNVFVNGERRTIEVGHIPILPDGPECSCGKRGCLEACLKSLDADFNNGMMFGAMEPSSPQFATVVNKAAEYLSMAVGMASQVFAPSAYLIVACNDGIASGIAAALKNFIKNDCFSTRLPDIYHAGYDPLYIQRGINDRVLSHYFFEEGD